MGLFWDRCLPLSSEEKKLFILDRPSKADSQESHPGILTNKYVLTCARSALKKGIV